MIQQTNKEERVVPAAASFGVRKPPLHLFVGVAALAASHLLLLARVEPVYTYFFSFAWWPYIILVDGLVYWRTGDSLLMNRRREFLVVTFWSIAGWCVYECFNFRIQNWYYVLAPQPPWAYRLNYTVGFASVFPAVFETTELLYSFGCLRHVRTPPCWIQPWMLVLIFFGGVISIVLPLAWPLFFFPLIWISTTLLLEPVLYRFGGRSLLADLERGDPHRLLSLLAAGFVLGGLWEFWNMLTRTKWIYTVPFFENLKLFEMPLLGYLGFPPFAVACYVLYAFLGLFRANHGWERESRRFPSRVPKALVVAGLGVALVFHYAVFEGITHWTVYSHHLSLSALAGVTHEESRAFAQAGLRYPYEVVQAVDRQGLETVAAQTELSPERMHELDKISRLIEMKGIGFRFFRLLHAASITEIETLAEQDSERLTARLIRLAKELGLRPPYKRQVQVWIREARRVARHDESSFSSARRVPAEGPMSLTALRLQ